MVRKTPMKANLTSFILLLTLSAGIYPAAGVAVGLQASEDRPFAAVVAAEEAKFIIPVGKRGRWEWFLESTKENLREYTWQVAVKNGEDSYAFGYSLFKKPGSTQQSGDLAALIKAGQQSVWQVSASGQRRGGRVIYDAGVSVEPDGENVIILIKGKENVDRLFSSRPEKVTFEMRTEAKRPERKTVNVTYKS
jgi:hypothetical protein